MSAPRAMIHSSLDLFDRISILEPIDCSNTQKNLSYEFLECIVFGIPVRIGQKHDNRLAGKTLFLKVKFSKRHVALDAADHAMFVNNTMRSFLSTCEVCFVNEKSILPMDFILTKQSFLMNFLIRKEPRALFAHFKVICTRKKRRRFETNSSSRRAKKNEEICFNGKLAINVSLAINSYSPTSESGYD